MTSSLKSQAHNELQTAITEIKSLQKQIRDIENGASAGDISYDFQVTEGSETYDMSNILVEQQKEVERLLGS